MSDKLKKLTGKNPSEFEAVARELVENCDEVLFAQLVERDDFLFDFVKQNVSKRLEKACNSSNFRNLLNFLKYYSPSYEDFIVNTLAKYCDDDLINTMLDILKTGTDDEKTYCAKFFSVIKNPCATEFLRQNVYVSNLNLSANCVHALAEFGDKEIYDNAIKQLNSEDDFEKLQAVRLLVSYGDKSAVEPIINTIKHSSLAENMASELLYLSELPELLDKNYKDGLFILNLIVDALGETVVLSQVFDFGLYDVFETIINGEISSAAAVVLLNAKTKFETLTENNEYLYDEAKDVKQEIFDIKSLLFNVEGLSADNELNSDSLFVYTALDLTTDADKVRKLLNSNNPTVVMKSLEVLKRLNSLTIADKDCALEAVENEDLINVIMAI